MCLLVGIDCVVHKLCSVITAFIESQACMVIAQGTLQAEVHTHVSGGCQREQSLYLLSGHQSLQRAEWGRQAEGRGEGSVGDKLAK